MIRVGFRVSGSVKDSFKPLRVDVMVKGSPKGSFKDLGFLCGLL